MPPYFLFIVSIYCIKEQFQKRREEGNHIEHAECIPMTLCIFFLLPSLSKDTSSSIPAAFVQLPEPKCNTYLTAPSRLEAKLCFLHFLLRKITDKSTLFNDTCSLFYSLVKRHSGYRDRRLWRTSTTPFLPGLQNVIPGRQSWSKTDEDHPTSGIFFFPQGTWSWSSRNESETAAKLLGTSRERTTTRKVASEAAL